MRQRKRSAASQKSRSWRGISITAVIRTLSLYKSYLFIYAADLILLSRHFRSLVSWGSRIEFFDLSTTQANCPTWWYVHGKQLAGNSGNMARCFRCDADVWPKFHSDLVGSCPCTKDRNESNSFNSLLFVQPPSKPILSPHSNFPLDNCKLYCTCFVNLVSSRETTDVTSSTRALRFRRQRQVCWNSAMQPRLQTIPSCESVHLLGREKHQKGVLSPVGAPQLTEGNHTGRKWWKCENFRTTLTSINRTLSSKPHFTRPHWVVLGHGCGGKICFSDIFRNVQASHNTLFQPKFIIWAESWSIILQPTPKKRASWETSKVPFLWRHGRRVRRRRHRRHGRHRGPAPEASLVVWLMASSVESLLRAVCGLLGTVVCGASTDFDLFGLGWNLVALWRSHKIVGSMS